MQESTALEGRSDAQQDHSDYSDPEEVEVVRRSGVEDIDVPQPGDNVFFPLDNLDKNVDMGGCKNRWGFGRRGRPTSHAREARLAPKA